MDLSRSKMMVNDLIFVPSDKVAKESHPGNQ